MNFNAGIFSANPEGATEILQTKKVFIAGAGGLGSNVALMLARAGIGFLAIADFDKVAESNLNRQFFFADQIGRPKIAALADNLRRAIPGIRLELYEKKITPENMPELITDDFDVICECFDNPECKAQLTEFILTERSDTPLVTVSGLAGIDDTGNLKIERRALNWFVVGDGSSEAGLSGTIASRVMCAAAIQAHLAIRIMLKQI